MWNSGRVEFGVLGCFDMLKGRDLFFVPSNPSFNIDYFELRVTTGSQSSPVGEFQSQNHPKGLHPAALGFL